MVGLSGTLPPPNHEGHFRPFLPVTFFPRAVKTHSVSDVTRMLVF